MNRSTPNILEYCKRSFLVFATVILVLLTSCAVKGSIKSIAGIPIGTERSIPKSNHQFSSSSIEQCAEFEIADAPIVQKKSFNANDLLPVVLFTTTFLFLLGLRPVIKENKHPIYSGSSKIRSTVPIFLEYRKLILHFVH